MTTSIPPSDPANFPFLKTGYALDAKTDQLYAQTPACFGPQEPTTIPPALPPYLSRNPGDLGPLGCQINSPGEDLLFRKHLMQNRGFKGDSFISQSNEGPIMIQTSAYNSSKITPMYGEYSEQLFQTPYDRLEEMESIGITTNAYTGEVTENFISAMPPPDTDKSIMPSLLKQTNPHLIWLQGGDPNHPRANKKEICQNLPGSDAGPNVWGSQLYQDQIGALQTNITMRQIFNNRNGIYPGELGFAKERPMGFTGLRNDIRWVPYLPPTQYLDIKDWTPTSGEFTGIPEPSTNPLIVSDVFTRRVDLSDNPYCGTAEYIVGDFMPTEDPLKRTTQRGVYAGAGIEHDLRPNADKTELGQYVVLDYDPRPTLKTATMQQAYPTHNANEQQLGTYVVLDTDPRPSLKTATMQQAYATHNANAQQLGTYAEIQEQDNEGTRRQFYSDQELMGFVSPVPMTAGDNLGPGAVFSNNYRGYQDVWSEWTHPSSHVDGVGGESVRWLGQSDRDPRTEMVPNVPVADFQQATGVNTTGWAPVCIPDVRPSWKMKNSGDIFVQEVRAGPMPGGIFQAA